MKTLQIDEKNAKKLFKNASPEFKQALIDTFGEKFFTGKITERIKSFLDACEEIGEDPLGKKFSTGTPDDIAYQKLKVIAKALRDGVVLDYSNKSQQKWYPYFIYGGSGFRFHDSYYGLTDTGAAGGSRLCVDTEEKAKHLGTTPEFLELYNQLLK